MNHEDSKKIKVPVDEDLSDLIPGFLENRRQDLTQIGQALGRGDFETVRHIGHSMKGSGGGYGFEKISQLGQSLEQAALGQDKKEAEQALDQLAFYLEHLEVVYVPDPDENNF